MGKISGFIGFILAGLLGVGCVAAYSYAARIDYSNNENQSSDDTNLETQTIEQGLKLKRLAITTLENGDVQQTFTYSFEKQNVEDVINESIEVRSYYQDDETDASDVISVSKDEENKIITVTNIGGKAFSRIIIIEVKSVIDEDVKALVTCQYQKKLLNLSFTHDSREEFLEADNSDIRQLILDYSNENHVSTYTLDYDYSSLDVSKLEIYAENLTISLLEGEVGSSGSFEDYENFEAIESILPDLETIFKSHVEDSLRSGIFSLNEVIPSALDIWEVNNSNSYHNFIKSYCNGNLGFRIDLNNKVTLNLDDGTKVTPLESATFDCYLHYDFTNYNLAPSGINSSTPELIY